MLKQPVRTVYGKWTFRVTEVKAHTQAVVPGAFDVAGGNAEYSIPACKPSEGTERQSECIHMASTQQSIGLALKISDELYARCPNGYAELVHAHGHQHVAGLGMELYDDNTGELLCATKPIYKDGFIVGIPPCVWGPPPLRPPPILHWNDSIFMTSRYNSTEEHHGVMGFWFVQVAHQCGNRNTSDFGVYI